MKIAVIGGGAVGSAVAYDLALRDDVEEIRVCDSRAHSLQVLRKLIDSPRLQPYQVDGRDTTLLAPIVEDCDCIVGCADPVINLKLAQLALSVGTHFCDQGGSDYVSDKILLLGDEAKEKGIWLIPDCGLAPGLVNILCLMGIEEFDEVENAFIRVGDIPQRPTPPFNFRVSTSAEKIIEDYSNPAVLIQDGALTSVNPLTGVEPIFFREPYGLLETFYSAVNMHSLSEHLEGQVRNLDLKTIRWPGHADQWRFVLGLGFGEKQSIDLRTHLTYRDVLIRRLRRLLGDEQPDVVLVRIVINGVLDGQKKTLVIQMIDAFNDEEGLSAIRRSTSMPTATVATLLGGGKLEGGGASPPELVLDKSAFIEQLIHRDLSIDKTWHDGWLLVTDTKEHML
ncbi:MAG: saccharopine dehydrogenase [Rhodothermales bacterium]|nr:saccharopine dehydrogenase [Rhodothermales bacterium]